MNARAFYLNLNLNMVEIQKKEQNNGNLKWGTLWYFLSIN